MTVLLDTQLRLLGSIATAYKPLTLIPLHGCIVVVTHLQLLNNYIPPPQGLPWYWPLLSFIGSENTALSLSLLSVSPITTALLWLCFIIGSLVTFGVSTFALYPLVFLIAPLTSTYSINKHVIYPIFTASSISWVSSLTAPPGISLWSAPWYFTSSISVKSTLILWHLWYLYLLSWQLHRS